MPISGQQYYWFITAGLICGLLVAGIAGFADGVRLNEPVVAIAFASMFMYATIATFVVVLEVWDRFGLGVALLAFLAAPALIVYWLSRIKGVSGTR